MKPAAPLLGTGVVRHRRLRPREHAFAYRTYFVWLPMRSYAPHGCDGLPRNGRGLLSFHDSDHGDGRGDALAWLDELLAAEGVDDADGQAWLHTYPRVLGHVFKPVSFWYCHRADDTLAAIVVEVNNTFGDRHCYLLTGPQLAWGRELRARKVFHVSPFCRIEGGYRFRFMRTEAGADGGADNPAGIRTVARIDHDDDAGPLLQTSVSGRLAPLTSQAARAAFFGLPLMTLTIVARIHWHALRLLLKRVPFVARPRVPPAAVSRS